MELITYFGEKLSKKINKSVLASSGVIRLAIRDSQYDSTVLTLNEMREIFKNNLKTYLKKLRIENVDEVSEYMIHELNENQSILTMNIK